MTKFLIAGLGNIGDEYAMTRHNAGFLVADQLAQDCGAKFASGRHAWVAEARHKGRQLVIIKPTTYMNLSGKAVAYWLQAEKIAIENLLVVVDEIALPFGKIRLGPQGSDGGHNGLKSVQEVLGTTAYARLRFGVGNTFSRGGQVDYVLGAWDEEQASQLGARVKLASDAVKAFVFAGLQRAMNEFNTK
jgi:PTH1 family peptidyl-tRNA hydrolase